MTILKKSLAVLLTVALMLGSISVAASAANYDPASDDNTSLTMTLKFFRKDADSGEWIETNRAKPGEELRLYYYAGTDYYTGAMNVGFAFDKQYFALDGKAPGALVDDLIAINGSYMGDALQIEEMPLTWWLENSRAITRGVNQGLLTQDEADKNYFVSGSVMQTAGTRNQILTDSEELFYVEQVTVRDNDYVKTAGQEGVAYVPEKFAITPGSTGVYSFPKGPDESGAEHDANDLKISGNGWTVDATSNPGVISVFSNVVLDANGGAFVSTDSSTTKTLSGVIGEQVTGIDASTPRKENSTFLGWSLTPDGAVLTAAEKAELMYDYEDQTLYAQWRTTDSGENSYLIKRYYMNTDGSYPAEPDVETIENVGFGTYPASTATTEGFKLDETMPNVTSAVVSETVTTDAVLYFARQGYTLKYHYTDNNGAQVDSYEDILYGAALPTFQGNDGNPAREGYEFKGWALTEGDASTIVNTATMTMPASDLDLFAIEELQSFTYVFDAGDGAFANGDSVMTYAYDYNEVPQAAEEPTREGFEFIGWDAELPEKVTEDKEFVATWSPIDYTLTWLDFEGNEIQTDTFWFGDQIDNTFVPEGYKDDAWINTEDGTTAQFPFSMPAKDVTLQAAPDATIYKAHFMVDGEEFAVTENAVDADILLPADEPTKEGYTFLMWDPEPGIQEAEDMYFDAVFEIGEFTVTYDPNGGEIVAPDGFEENADDTISITGEFETQIAVPEDPTRDGYVFVGWDKDTPNAIPGEDTVITAQWRAEQHTLTIDANGGQFADGSNLVTVTDYTGANISDKTPNNPTRDGYVFDGWEPATPDDVLPTRMPGEDITYVAQWTPERHTVTFDTNGGEPEAIDPITGNTGDPITLPDDPTKEGYTFGGWVDENGDPVDLDTIPADDITVIADWIPETYNAIFNANGGAFSADPSDTVKVVPTNYGETIVVPAEPTREGYTFEGWAPVPAEMPNHDVTFNAKWEPIPTGEADYIINVYLENPAAPGTYLDPTQKTGTVEDGQTIEITDGMSDADVPISYSGLTDSEANEPDPENENNVLTITATEGGDNVLNAYFKLKTFTVNFDENGGEIEEGSNEVIGYYGEDIEKPTVSREGYNFLGWQNDETGNIEEVPATFTKDGSYTAQWEKKTNTVTFNINGEPYDTKTLEYGDPVEAPAYTAPEGYEFGGWEIPAGTTMGDDPLTYDAVLTPIDYTLTYSVTGDVPADYTTPATEIGKHVGDTVTLAAVEAPEGYTFNGWKIEGPTYDPGTDYTMPAKNVIATGSFTAKEYLIDFNTDGGSYLPHESHKAGEAIVANTLPKPTKDGFTFQYWQDENGNQVTDFTMPAKDITLKAIWEAIPNYTATFDLVGGNIGGNTANPTVTGPEGTAITAPADPTKDGYTFAGWQPAVDATMPNHDVTYVAQWTEIPSYTATFDLAGGNIGGDTTNPTVTGPEGTAITAPADPTKDGYTFAGWQPTVDAAMPNHDVTYVAQWTEIPSYTVTFDLAGGNIDGNTENPTQTGKAGDAITAPADPTKDGYTFAGWQPEVDATIPEGGKTYVAQWTEIPSYTATFDLAGGNIGGDTTNPTVTGPEGTAITAPADPTKDGYTFNGWQPAVDAAMPNHDVTYVAQWTEIPSYTATFDLAGGNIGGDTANPTVTGPEGTAITAPADPTKDGYTFNGWQPAVDATMPNHDVTYVAQWTEVAVPTHSITYYLADGDDTPYQTDTYPEGDTIVPPTEPTATGFTFDGWADKDGNPIPDTMGTEDITAYAKWTPIEYKVTYINEGEVYQTYDVPYGAEVPKPADPESADPANIFAGWTPAIPASMPAEDLTFTAEYITKAPEQYTATYIVDGTTYKAYTVNEGDPIPVPADPEKFAYRFKGWNPEVPATMPGQDMVFEAEWELDPTFVAVVVGGTVIGGAAIAGIIGANTAMITGASIVGGILVITLAKHTHTVKYLVDGELYRFYLVVEGTKIPVPKDPTKDGATFQGWNPEVPERMPAQDLTFEATWDTDPAPEKPASDTDVKIPETGSAAGIAAFTAISGAAAAAFLYMKKKRDED